MALHTSKLERLVLSATGSATGSAICPGLPALATFMGEGKPSSTPNPCWQAARLDPMKLFLSQSFAPLRRFCLILLAIAVVMAASGAFAQEEENRQLDTAKQSLDQIEKELAAGTFDDPALIEVQRRIDQSRGDIQRVTDALVPRAQAITGRLEQLGPAPAEGQPPESPEIAQERDAQTKARQPIDEVLKRASLLGVQADQLSENLAGKRRDLFATRVLARTKSLLDPTLWLDVMNELPRRISAAQTLLGEWRDRFVADQRGFLPLGAVALALIIGWPLRRWIQRFGQQYFAEQAPATRLRRSAAALWVLLIITATPVAGAVLIYYGLTVPGLVPERALPFLGKLIRLTAFVSFVAGLTRAILAPGRPSWRLPPLSDEMASRLAPYPLYIAGTFALAQAILAFLDVIGVGLAPVMLINGIAAVAIAVTFVLAMRPAKEASEEVENQPAHSEDVWLASIVRVVAWAAIVVVVMAAVAGYISFSFFLASQMLWLGVLGGLLYLLLTLVDDLLLGWGGDKRLLKFAKNTVGFQKNRVEQLCVLASGILRLVLIVMAVLLAIAPWGVESGHVVGWIGRAFTGITFGGLSFSLAAVFGALVLLIAGILLTRGVQGWLDKSYLPHTKMDDGLKNSIRTATGWAGVLLAIGLAVSSLGFGLDRIAIVAGALSVGIGFGLQSVVSNFVSGLILLAERPIKVGDWVSVGGDEGNVRRISVRSTAIEMFDNSILIVPNSDLITKPVRNRTHQSQLGVVRVAIGTGHGADVQEVRSILLGAVASVQAILANPPPSVLIQATTDLGVQWQLTCNVPSPRQVASARSELYFAVLKEFQAKNITITASAAT
jgi:small-conductance mechanosensitive channel